MPNHRQTLGTTSTKQRRQVANEFKTRLAASVTGAALTDRRVTAVWPLPCAWAC